MTHVSYAGALLAVAALLSIPASAQTGAQQTGAQKSSAQNGHNARIQHVTVRGGDAAMEVEIQTSGTAVAPDTQAITGPDRIIVDFPGALPAAELRALTVNRGALKGVRTGLFSNNPPITRVVFDLAEPQSYQVSTLQNAIVVKLSPAALNSARLNSPPAPAILDRAKSGAVASGPKGPAVKTVAKTIVAKASEVSASHAAKLQPASLVGSAKPASMNVAASSVSAAVSPTDPPLAAGASTPLPPMPLVTVTFTDGKLRIHAENATLSQVLFEVQRQTQAEIAIPAGAEREQVIADLGPASARDVLSALLNGSPYNFIFVGNEQSLERVILTRRDPNIF